MKFFTWLKASFGKQQRGERQEYRVAKVEFEIDPRHESMALQKQIREEIKKEVVELLAKEIYEKHADKIRERLAIPWLLSEVQNRLEKRIKEEIAEVWKERGL